MSGMIGVVGVPPPQQFVRRRRTNRHKSSAGQNEPADEHECAEGPSRVLLDVRSRGSKNHLKGHCRPCRHNGTGSRCPMGSVCDSCHYHHDPNDLIIAREKYAADKQRKRLDGLAKLEEPAGGKQEGYADSFPSSEEGMAPPKSLRLVTLPKAATVDQRSHVASSSPRDFPWPRCSSTTSPAWSGSTSPSSCGANQFAEFASPAAARGAAFPQPSQLTPVMFGATESEELARMLEQAAPASYTD